MRVRLRALDDEVLDAERALAVPGDDDVADLLARTEALRERSRGLANLVAERRRGLERELAAVADEGVVETLVAEAAQLREQLAAVDADFDVARADAHRGRRGRAPRRGTRRAVRLSEPTAEAAHHDARRDLEQLTEHARSTQSSASSRKPATELDGPTPSCDDARAGRWPRPRPPKPKPRPRARRGRRRMPTVAPELTAEARDVRAAEEAAARRRRASGATPEAEASRWRAAGRDARARARRAHAAAAERRSSALDGVLGPLVDHIEIDAGAEIAVAAALGDALKAIVVDGDDAARDAVERLKRGDRPGAAARRRERRRPGAVSSRRPGARPLGACVRAARDPASTACSRACSRRSCSSTAAGQPRSTSRSRRPAMIAVTREGDRFGGAEPVARRAARLVGRSPRPRSPTRRSAPTTAETARAEAEPSASKSRAQQLAAARRAELVATEHDARAAGPSSTGSWRAPRSSAATSRSAPRRSTSGTTTLRREAPTTLEAEARRRFPSR